ncbi:YeeE/YedE family protein [Motiliproteus coralliicola]|uniref:YeeE/YedE family protein n=1 Tax=Motiliproteus coralliicola TaxID=2283196 RepID=A0A369WGI6_9GAMM|nr:DUF6691 family protein [Motiliproteus coralliicola]RDE19804.1 YeeE/YedE family protein [Motiliproteus coralliicola]
MKNLLALLAGGLFGAGLAMSGMTDTTKVIGFLDVSGGWDLTLALVMIGALLVTVPGYYWILQQPRPACATRFDMPAKTSLDAPLVLGAALFGIGWGLVGYCPGPSIAVLGYGNWQVVPFLMMLLLGGWLAGPVRTVLELGIRAGHQRA